MTPDHRRRRVTLALLLATCAALAVALLLFDRRHTYVWAAIFNASHVVVALALTLAAYWVVATWRPAWTALHRYAAALTVTVVAGAGLELAQLVGPGDASMGDLARDVVGGVAAILVHLACTRRRRLVAIALVAAALLLMAPLMYPGARALMLYSRIVRQLPAVAAFQGPGEASLLRTMDGGSVVKTPPPAAWTQATRSVVGKVTFAAGYRNPRILITNPFADWGAYQALVFTVYSPEERPLSLMVRIDDIDATISMTDRFHRRLTIAPGHNQLRIPLADVRNSPAHRELDLGALENVVFFMERPSRDRVLFFERFWLE